MRNNGEYKYIEPTKYLARWILGEDEKAYLLVPCPNWNKYHQCYEKNFSSRVNVYNPKNPFHWRFKFMTWLTNSVVFA